MDVGELLLDSRGEADDVLDCTELNVIDELPVLDFVELLLPVDVRIDVDVLDCDEDLVGVPDPVLDRDLGAVADPV